MKRENSLEEFRKKAAELLRQGKPLTGDEESCKVVFTMGNSLVVGPDY